AAGGAPASSAPPTTRLPAVGRSSPACARRSVDLPLPDGPTTAVTSPAASSASTAWRASIPPAGVEYVLERPRQAASGSGDTERLGCVGAAGEPARERPGGDRGGEER